MDYCDTWGQLDKPREIRPSADMGDHGFVCVVDNGGYIFGLCYSEKKDWSVHS